MGLTTASTAFTSCYIKGWIWDTEEIQSTDFIVGTTSIDSAGTGKRGGRGGNKGQEGDEVDELHFVYIFVCVERFGGLYFKRFIIKREKKSNETDSRCED